MITIFTLTQGITIRSAGLEILIDGYPAYSQLL